MGGLFILTPFILTVVIRAYWRSLVWFLEFVWFACFVEIKVGYFLLVVVTALLVPFLAPAKMAPIMHTTSLAQLPETYPERVYRVYTAAGVWLLAGLFAALFTLIMVLFALMGYFSFLITCTPKVLLLSSRMLFARFAKFAKFVWFVKFEVASFVLYVVILVVTARVIANSFRES